MSDHPGVSASLLGRSVLFKWLEEVRDWLRASWKLDLHPVSVTGPFGTHGIEYGEDENGKFAVVGFCLPDDIFAEIEDGTYGLLQAFRIYEEDE